MYRLFENLSTRVLELDSEQRKIPQKEAQHERRLTLSGNTTVKKLPTLVMSLWPPGPLHQIWPEVVESYQIIRAASKSRIKERLFSS